MKWFLKCLRKYAVFTGRARRKEYWMFILFSMLGGFAMWCLWSLISGASDATLDLVASFYQLFLSVPGLAVGVRRMHDTDRSGWFILVPFYNVYLAVVAMVPWVTTGSVLILRTGANSLILTQPRQYFRGLKTVMLWLSNSLCHILNRHI